MSFSLDVSANWQTWPNCENVTLASAASTPPGATQYALATAKRRNPTYKERIPTGGVYGAALLTWLVPHTVLQGVAPDYQVKPADTIQDAGGVVYTILEAQLNALRSTWRCVTLNLSLAYALRDAITIERNSLTTDAAAGRTYTWTTLYSGVQARIQETEADTIDERGKRLTRHRYTVPVLYAPLSVVTPLDLRIEDRVKDAAGNVFEIRGWRNVSRIDELQQLDLERRW